MEQLLRIVRFEFKTIGTAAHQRQVYRLSLKARLTRGLLHQLCRLRQIKIDQLAALGADRVIVAIRNPVVATGAIAEAELADETSLTQITKGVVNGSVTDCREVLLGRRKDIARGRMVISLAHGTQNRLALRRQPLLVPIC